MDGCLFRSIRCLVQVHSNFQDWNFWLLDSFEQYLVHGRGSTMQTRRGHLLLACGGTILTLIPLQACGSSYLSQKQQLGPNLHCVPFTKVCIWKAFVAVSVSAVGTGGAHLEAWLSAARLQVEALPPSTRCFQWRGHVSFIRKKTNPNGQCHGVSQEKRKTVFRCPRWAPLMHLCVGLAWGREKCIYVETKRRPPQSHHQTCFPKLNDACLAAS